jgi:hypothetical protein
MRLLKLLVYALLAWSVWRLLRGARGRSVPGPAGGSRFRKAEEAEFEVLDDEDKPSS